MVKFGRNYRLIIQTNDSNEEAIIIEPPITLQFTINRSTMGTLNSMRLQIMNLSEKTRNKIFQDRFNPKVYKKIILQAGYNNLSNIFIGNIYNARSFRANTEIVTFIYATDGGFDTANTLSNGTIQKQTSYKDFLVALVNSFPNLKQGKLTEIEGEFRRPAIVNGNSFELIRKYSNNKAYIDLETINILNDSDVIEGDVPLLNSETGLLGTPDRADAYLSVETIFEPRIIMGQVIEIQSDVQKKYDGQYKVIGVTHSGIISDAVGGQCSSKFNLLVGTQLFGGFNIVS